MDDETVETRCSRLYTRIRSCEERGAQTILMRQTLAVCECGRPRCVPVEGATSLALLLLKAAHSVMEAFGGLLCHRENGGIIDDTQHSQRVGNIHA